MNMICLRNRLLQKEDKKNYFVNKTLNIDTRPLNYTIDLRTELSLYINIFVPVAAVASSISSTAGISRFQS